MAKELAHFINFAKLKDTSLEFNDITVLAGKPSTGKSYVMKFIYAIEEATYLVDKDYWNNYKSIWSFLEGFYYYDKNNQLPQSTLLYEMLENSKYQELLEFIENNNFDLHNKDKAIKFLQMIINKQNDIKYYLNNISKSIFVNLNQISKKFEYQSKEILFKFDNNKILVDREIKYTIENIQEPIFVETPLILEFKFFMRREKGKVPYHIESLLNVLDTDYSFTDIEQDRFIQNFTKKAKEIISGDIESRGDSFIYRTDAKNYDILNTSSGTKSIGLLQYLVTNKALKKGSILFWEEPEVHLHPQWQLKMIDLFIELMRAGVKIVFSTHSPYMADYLNAISQKNGFKDRVSFNLLKEQDGIVENIILSDVNWKEIQAELLDPLEEIMWEYI